MTKIQLNSYVGNKLAKPHQYNNVTHFMNAKKSMKVERIDGDRVKVSTNKDFYILDRHEKLNIYMGEANGHKVHVSLKKLVGELRYW